MRKNVNKNNYKFIDSAILNTETYIDYLSRFRKICLSMFEWENLPPSMDRDWLEICLFEKGSAAFLYDKKYGYINTNCASSGKLNIYHNPTQLNCYSFDYQTTRLLYSGLNNNKEDTKEAILVKNNIDMTPTLPSMELFAYRLYEADRTCDVNIKLQKIPLLILCDEKQRLMVENLLNQINGNYHTVIGNKSNLSDIKIEAIKTDVPYIADKIIEYKKEIWNEALTFLGINNLMLDKKERLVADEANSNNELINLNLLGFLNTRKKACEQFRKKFGIDINVKVSSDLHNIIKQEESIVNKYNVNQDIEGGK